MHAVDKVANEHDMTVSKCNSAATGRGISVFLKRQKPQRNFGEKVTEAIIPMKASDNKHQN